MNSSQGFHYSYCCAHLFSLTLMWIFRLHPILSLCFEEHDSKSLTSVYIRVCKVYHFSSVINSFNILNRTFILFKAWYNLPVNWSSEMFSITSKFSRLRTCLTLSDPPLVSVALLDAISLPFRLTQQPAFSSGHRLVYEVSSTSWMGKSRKKRVAGILYLSNV